ncbi:HesA/MoeB/ThiF family protein [Albidovulum sediminicola]|uniref:Molybdopterin-synthase adenylyltransferase MoeB n=1 Tax=Albidovulum sediminicola TaxID=2984331 RepID=A0ABT2Z2C8_9RHOB|nr:molybdopterin-synthase adenylyltransferase MoeB [Defluviimonas sp. WL0075]MCV2865271.1 molybdopterin-synthase adenylyltransferase MoeB [Defluviimonas sp. WL0075]
MTVLLIAAFLVALGLVLKFPAQIVWGMLLVLWGAVVLAHLLLPQGHALARALGGSFEHWLVAGGVVAMILTYRKGLGVLRGRVRPAPPPAQTGAFSPAELDRYARHIVLREVGGPGQKRLKGAKVLVVGAGGLGSPSLLYLAAAGVGTIGVIDDDIVSSSNLQRQVIHTDARIGQPKVFSAEAAMKALNPFIEIRPHNRRLSEAEAPALFAGYDLILDGSDNFDTRYMINAAAVAAGKPLISAAITQWEGQISLYDPARGAPCYACIFPERPADGLAPACAVAGVMGALPGVVGAMMAVEAIKEITGAGEGLRGRMLIYDALYAEARGITLKRNPDCAVCGGVHG